MDLHNSSLYVHREIETFLNWARWKFFRYSLEKCSTCDHHAQWQYMSSSYSKNDRWCDNCVPRGCSCNAIDEYGEVQATDELGRELPCCENWFYKWGWKK